MTLGVQIESLFHARFFFVLHGLKVVVVLVNLAASPPRPQSAQTCLVLHDAVV